MGLKSIVGSPVKLVRDQGLSTFLRRAIRFVVRLIYAVYWLLEYDINFKSGLRAAMSTELPVFRDLFANLREDDVFYDVGADTGLFACPVADMLGPNRVVAFEPGEGAQTLNQRLLEANLEATVVEKAVTQRQGTDYHAHEGRVGLLGDTDAPQFNTITGGDIVEAEELPLPTVVKIDVFGAERDVVESLEEVLARDECRLVYLELHLPMTFQRKRPEHIFDQYLDEWSLTDILGTLFRCGFEVDPIYLRAETDDLFVKAYKPDH